MLQTISVPQITDYWTNEKLMIHSGTDSQRAALSDYNFNKTETLKQTKSNIQKRMPECRKCLTQMPKTEKIEIKTLWMSI